MSARRLIYPSLTLRAVESASVVRTIDVQKREIPLPCVPAMCKGIALHCQLVHQVPEEGQRAVICEELRKIVKLLSKSCF